MEDEDWTAFTVRSEGPEPRLPNGIYWGQIYREGDPPLQRKHEELRKDGGWYWGWEEGRPLLDREVILRVQRIGDLPE